jgi:hypothetical protein
MNTKTLPSTPVILSAVAALALVTVSCGGSMRRVQGAQFELNAQEDDLADQWERQEPGQAGLRVRCDYWRRQAAEAMRDHAMGMLIWHGDHFVTLRAWANARAADVCATLARREAERQKEERAAAKKAAEDARQAAEEARKEKAARDAAEAEARKAAEAERKKADVRESTLAAIREFEETAPNLAKGTLTTERLALYESHMERFVEVVEALKGAGGIDVILTEGEGNRLRAVLTRYNDVRPKYEKAMAAYNARAEQERKRADRAAALTYLRDLKAQAEFSASPTGRFVDCSRMCHANKDVCGHRCPIVGDESSCSSATYGRCRDTLCTNACDDQLRACVALCAH